MKPEALQAIREGAEISAMKPYIDSELGSMQRAVVSSVLAAINKGCLTPEMALSKWMEYIAYVKLNQRIEQKVRVGQSVGEANAKDLTFTPITYKNLP